MDTLAEHILQKRIPDEVWFHILIWVPYRDLLRYQRVNRCFLNIISDRVLWEAKSMLEYRYSHRLLSQRHPYSGYVLCRLENGYVDIGADEFCFRDDCLSAALVSSDFELLRSLMGSDRNFFNAASNEFVDLLEVLPTPPNPIILYSVYVASQRGHLNVVKYLFNKYVKLSHHIYEYAKLSGHPDILCYLESISEHRLRISECIDQLTQLTQSCIDANILNSIR